MLIRSGIGMARDHFLSRMCELILKACTVVVGNLPNSEIDKHNYTDIFWCVEKAKSNGPEVAFFGNHFS